MLSLARVVCACVVVAWSGVRGWRVLDSDGSNVHFYDRDKLHQNAGSGGSHYFGDNVVFAHYDDSAKTPPRKEHISDGTLDSMQYCKCIMATKCEPTATQPAKSHYACGAGQILCCYDGHPKYQQLINSDRYLNDGPYNNLQNTGTVPDEKWNPVNDPQDPVYYPPSSIPRLPNFKANGDMNNPSNFENLSPGGIFLNERRGPRSSSENFKAKKFLNNRPVLVRPGGLTGLTGPNTNNDIFNAPNNIPGDKGVLVGPEGPTGIIGPLKDRKQESPRYTLLTGPGGPKGIVSPPNRNYHLPPVSIDEMAGHTNNKHNTFIGADGVGHLVDKATYADEERNAAASAQRGVLVGPGGPTGIIGPNDQLNGHKGSLVGLGGPWGAIGPVDYDDDTSPSAQRGVLVGPGGPTGIIGPAGNRPNRLIGPGGYSGNIGPAGFSNRPNVLVGPGGPTGIIGPAGFNNRPNVLVGPGGPTGIIGPAGFNNRPNVLVGPGGPTGIIGPNRRPFGNRPLTSGYGGYGYRAQRTVLDPNWSSETPQRGVLVGPAGPTGQIGPSPGQ